MTEWLIGRVLPAGASSEDPKLRERCGLLSSLVGICCNLLLFVGKFMLGTLTNSIAVSADAFNNLSDVGSSLTTFLGFKLASKPADADHPFGHGRMEYLSGLLISFLILLVGFEIGKGAVEKILHPEPVSFSWVAVAGLLLSIGAKLWLGGFNRRLGRRIHSAAMEATAVDSVSDAISTGATLLAVVAAAFTTLPIDGVMGIFVAFLILKAGWGSAQDTLSPLLGAKADPELVNALEQRLLSYEGILGIHDLMVHDYGPGRRFASVHAEVPAERDIMRSHDVIDTAERQVAKELNLQLVIHMDPIQTDCDAVKLMRQVVLEKVQEIDPQFSIHDFRMVAGGQLTNLIFDINVGGFCALSDQEIKSTIDRKMKALDPNYYTVVVVDHAYA